MLMKILTHPAMQLIIKCYETAIYAAGGFMLIVTVRASHLDGRAPVVR